MLRKIGKIPYSMDRLKKPGDGDDIYYAVDGAGGVTGDIANGEVVGDIALVRLCREIGIGSALTKRPPFTIPLSCCR